jgi:hypothetical protein
VRRNSTKATQAVMPHSTARNAQIDEMVDKGRRKGGGRNPGASWCKNEGKGKVRGKNQCRERPAKHMECEEGIRSEEDGGQSMEETEREKNENAKV